jgi:hypothetical protein
MCRNKQETIKDRYENLMKSQLRTREVKLKVKRNKLNMCCKGLPYIVHLLNKDIIRSYPVKVNSIIEMSRPIEIQFVQSFNGFELSIEILTKTIRNLRTTTQATMVERNLILKITTEEANCIMLIHVL